MNQIQTIIDSFSRDDFSEKDFDVESSLPIANETIDSLVKDNNEVYQAFLKSDKALCRGFSSLVLKFLCERVLRSKNAWYSTGGCLFPNNQLLQFVYDWSVKEKRRIDNDFSDFYMAIYHHVTADDQQSLAYFNRAAQRFTTKHKLMESDEHGCLHLMPTDLLDVMPGKQANKINFSFQCKKIDDLQVHDNAIAIFFDDVYFKAFARHIINSVLSIRKKNTFNIHFHITNPSESSLILAQELTDLFANEGGTLCLSTNHDAVTDRAYFTCTRFLAIPELLKQYKNLLIMDADIEFLACPSSLFDELNGVDASLLFSKGPWGYKPWRKCWAGFCYLESGEGALLYARLIATLINRWWDLDRQNNWWIDQNALYIAYSLVSAVSPAVTIKDHGNIHERYISSSEELKLRLLKNQNDVSELMKEKNIGWNEALRTLQL